MSQHIDQTGGIEELRCLRGHPGGQQRDQHGRDREDVSRRDGEQAVIGQRGKRGAGRESQGTAKHQRGCGGAGGHYSIEEQDHFGAFAQRGKTHHERQRCHRSLSARHLPADGGHGRSYLLAVAGHPKIVPHQHDHRDAEHAGIEQLLAGALKRVGNRLREYCEKSSAGQCRQDAGANPISAPAHAARHREHDPDDQTGLDDFPKDNYSCAQHRTIPRSRRLWPFPRGTRR